MRKQRNKATHEAISERGRRLSARRAAGLDSDEDPSNIACDDEELSSDESEAEMISEEDEESDLTSSAEESFAGSGDPEEPDIADVQGDAERFQKDEEYFEQLVRYKHLQDVLVQVHHPSQQIASPLTDLMLMADITSDVVLMLLT